MVTNQWSADFRRMAGDLNPYATGSVPLGEFAFPLPTLLAFVVALVVVLGAHAVLRRTLPRSCAPGLRPGPYHRRERSASTTRLAVALAAASGASAAIAGMLFAIGNALHPCSRSSGSGSCSRS